MGSFISDMLDDDSVRCRRKALEGVGETMLIVLQRLMDVCFTLSERFSRVRI